MAEYQDEKSTTGGMMMTMVGGEEEGIRREKEARDTRLG